MKNLFLITQAKQKVFSTKATTATIHYKIRVLKKHKIRRRKRHSYQFPTRVETFTVHYIELRIRLLTLSSSNFFPLVRFSFKIRLCVYSVNSFGAYAYSSRICRLGLFIVLSLKTIKKILTSKRNAIPVCCKGIYA